MPSFFVQMVRAPLGGTPVATPVDDDLPTHVGRRAAARLRLSIPARLVAVASTRPCVVMDLSRCGARIALEHPLEPGDAGILHFAGMEVFGCVIRCEEGVNGLEFDPNLTDDDVLRVRRFAEALDRDKHRLLLDNARLWVTGEAKE